MAYNNGFPVNYPQYYPQFQQIQQQNPVPTPQPQVQTQNNPMIWVQGETGGKILFAFTKYYTPIVG